MWKLVGLVVLASLIEHSHSARRADAGVKARAFMERYNSPFYKRTLEDEPPSLEEALHLRKTESLVKKSQDTTVNGHTKVRFVEIYQGVEVYDAVVTADLDDLTDVSGTVIEDIQDDIPSINSLVLITEEKAMEKAIQHAGLDPEENDDIIFNKNIMKKQIVMIDGVAYLCYLLSFKIDNGIDSATRPFYHIDAVTGDVKHTWPGLDNADISGTGGNTKTGDKNYGQNNDHLQLTLQGGTCTYQNSDVTVINLNQGNSGSSDTPYSVACPNNDVGSPDSINGGKSAANDAFYFGKVVKKMYKDWLDIDVLGGDLVLYVHLKTGYENAYWDGTAMYFGDGKDTFYPLVSLDVTAHEVSHGFTEQNSGLRYEHQSGGINEAFSDMSGEAAEYFMSGTNDWKVGFDIFKSPDGALRYMNNPTLDGYSIDHANNYVSSMDVHYSSGVYNKAFYNLATTSGWNTKKAFEIFAKANDMYWSATTNFVQGLCGVLKAANDRGYSTSDVKTAFLKVGVVPESSCNYGSTGTEGSGSDGDMTELADNVSVVGLQAGVGEGLYFKLTVPAGMTRLDFECEGSNGDLDLYIRFGSKPTLASYDHRPYYVGSHEWVNINNPAEGEYYAMLYGFEAFTDVTFKGHYSA